MQCKGFIQGVQNGTAKLGSARAALGNWAERVPVTERLSMALSEAWVALLQHIIACDRINMRCG